MGFFSKYNWCLIGLERIFREENNKINIEDGNLVVREENNKINPVLLKYYLVCLYSFIRVVFYYFKQFLVVRNGKQVGDIIILLVERKYRNANIQKSINIKDHNVTYIKTFDIADMMSYTKISAKGLLRELINSIVDFRYVMISGLSDNVKTIVLSDGSKIIAQYVYLTNFFKKIRNDNPSCEIYSGGAQLASYAAISAGLKCVYCVHGQVNQPIKMNQVAIMPKYSLIYVYSEYEKSWLIKHGVISDIHVYESKEIVDHCNVIIVFLGLVDSIDLKIISDVSSFFINMDYQVYLKIHPLCVQGDYKGIDVLDCNIIEDKNMDSTLAISKFRPRFALGSVSTALCEALKMGVIPVSINVPFEKKDEYMGFENCILYPYKRKSLSWDLEKNVIVDLVTGSESYSNILSNLKTR